MEISAHVTYRMARPDESGELARFMCIAGGGVYEFLFDDLIPFVTAVDLLSAGIGGERFPISYLNCCVAARNHDREIVAAANVFPADLLKDDNYMLLGSERHDHIRPMLELQDWGSMFLNSLAVGDAYRGSGIGARLLEWAEGRAVEAGYQRLSLHVWADNISAVKFYKVRGFIEVGIAGIPTHPRLKHSGGSILMSKPVSPAA
ncbi:MAG: GNAT family N-acetyltransferase [Bradyrhizobium sp.]|uniref:GNAT family N-acetyltransferase n=1 Tax=Bradyrhizobium sp. TaxID=376 RepID=UPI0027222543|nr:GNAT family N-acetyltransferase [Bradyrhizobium sp.]MDO9564198.1 GNAT family N-acetyltransferase [Bradyrhizobium sp.]MDP3693909.1 GNAT family N-acetyltransferase [Bradyrhizobium sp.]